MKVGDIVRWTPQNKPWFDTTLCLLVEYRKWEKMAVILCDGELLRVRGDTLQKAGKKDELSRKPRKLHAK
jgi:hypothetical protein